MPHELVTHARHEAAYLGGQVRELLAWWLGISFGGLSATLGLLIAIWPSTVHMWGGVFVGMWLLGVAFCRVSDLLTDPPFATVVRRVPGWAATGAALLAALAILRGMIGVERPLAITVTVVLSLIAFADVLVAVRRGGLRSRIGARAAVYLPAALATGAGALAGHLPAATVALAALAIGIVEAATAAITGMKSLRWHAASRAAGLLTGEIRPFRESSGDLDADAPLPPAARLVTSPPTPRTYGTPRTPAPLDPDQPAVVRPAADHPVIARPDTDQPAVARATTGLASIDKPATDRPTSNGPTTAEAGTTARPEPAPIASPQPEAAQPAAPRHDEPTRPGTDARAVPGLTDADPEQDDADAAAAARPDAAQTTAPHPASDRSTPRPDASAATLPAATDTPETDDASEAGTNPDVPGTEDALRTSANPDTHETGNTPEANAHPDAPETDDAAQADPDPDASGTDPRATATTAGTPLSRRPAGAAPRSTGRPAGRATVNRTAVGRAKVTTAQE